MEKKEFAVTALNPEHEAFVIHVVTLSTVSDDEMHSSRNAQIAHLKADEILVEVSSKYGDFANVFSPKLAAKLSKHTRIYHYAIKLVDNQQPLYSLIYS